MSKEEKMLILQMVADGKITPEQGAELLRALGEPKPEPSARPSVPPVPASSSTPTSPRTISQPAPQVSAIDESIRRAVESGVRSAQEAAELAARRTEEFAERIAREGENIGKVLGESGENLGRILGRLFSGWSHGGGNEFEFPEEIIGELPLEGEIKVNLSTRNGRITVDTWDEPTFRLQVIRKVNAATEEEAKARVNDLYEFTQDGLRLAARTKETLGGGLFGPSASVHFVLTLPRDRKADVTVSSANGRLTLDRLAGSSLKASTANGRIEATRCDFGRADLDSANGRILFGGSADDLTINTANGRIEGELHGAGQWVVGTANGRIELTVHREPGAAYEVDASSVSGRVEVTGLDDAEVIVNETRHVSGSRRYRARSRNYESAERRGSIKATTASGRVMVTF